MERKCVILAISGSKKVTTNDAQSNHDAGKPIAGNTRQGPTYGT